MHSAVKIGKTIVGTMVYYITFRPHLRPANDSSLHTFICNCIRSGIIHREKINQNIL